jgi:hypothetical protein
MAIEVPAIRSLGASFAYTNYERDGTIYAYDIGGKLLEQARAIGLTEATPPPGYDRCFTHIGGMTWRAAPTLRSEQRRWIRQQRARLELARLRLAMG